MAAAAVIGKGRNYSPFQTEYKTVFRLAEPLRFLPAMTSHNTRHFSKNLFALVIVQCNIPLCQISLIFKILGVF